MQDELRFIPLDEIVEPWLILRVVNRGSVEYLQLRDSLADKGFLNPVCVRPSSRKSGKMELVDGLYRFTAASELKLPVAPAIIKHNLTDEDVLAAQIQANALRPETTAVEYARQLRKLMAGMSERLGRDITLAELSVRIHSNPEWISSQLLLLDLNRSIQKAVERGEIPLCSAYALARVPCSRQAQFVDMAKTMQAKEFVPIVHAFVKRFKEAVRTGYYEDLFQTFKPRPHLRPVLEVLAEYSEHNCGGLMLANAGCQVPIDAWYLALQWVLHLDEASVEEDRKRLTQLQQSAVLEREEEDEP
jgi:ParB/RepB/Spo0J family partition protein